MARSSEIVGLDGLLPCPLADGLVVGCGEGCGAGLGSGFKAESALASGGIVGVAIAD